ncbi:hypothetical protein B0H16DRAFT_1710898 [Mycena metata]|uniref:Uncharacterized protein n=1 Tax=Mycena metata TaxID=1033252 RepID=A0AAD7NY03_9AGAR|nr:hypothetical protein B0H16DRAFT_1710898 [Mycena metata]
MPPSQAYALGTAAPSCPPCTSARQGTIRARVDWVNLSLTSHLAALYRCAAGIARGARYDTLQYLRWRPTPIVTTRGILRASPSTDRDEARRMPGASRELTLYAWKTPPQPTGPSLRHSSSTTASSPSPPKHPHPPYSQSPTPTFSTAVLATQANSFHPPLPSADGYAGERVRGQAGVEWHGYSDVSMFPAAPSLFDKDRIACRQAAFRFGWWGETSPACALRASEHAHSYAPSHSSPSLHGPVRPHPTVRASPTPPFTASLVPALRASSPPMRNAKYRHIQLPPPLVVVSVRSVAGGCTTPYFQCCAIDYLHPGGPHAKFGDTRTSRGDGDSSVGAGAVSERHVLGRQQLSFARQTHHHRYSQVE